MCPNPQSTKAVTNQREPIDSSRESGPVHVRSELTSLSDVLGRKWSLVIVHNLLRDGPQGFSALLNEIDGISSKVLSESLDDLEEAGLVDRDIVSERPFRVEYSLTERGTALDSVIDKVQQGVISVA